MAPLGLVVLALLWEIGYKAVDRSRRIINGSFMKYMMIILYFVLSATTQIIMKTFFCVSFDDGLGNIESFLQVDMVISCDNARYKFIHTYATLMAVICE